MTYATTGMRFEETGDDRPPRRGEWYRGTLGVPVLAWRNFSTRCLPILHRVDDGARSEEELERERLDSEAQTAAPATLPPAPPRPHAASPIHQDGLRPISETAREISGDYRLPYTDNDSEEDS